MAADRLRSCARKKELPASVSIELYALVRKCAYDLPFRGLATSRSARVRRGRGPISAVD